MDLWKDNVSNAPLNLRGWVFQERLLSPRVLHFGQKQIFWECRELEGAESFPRGIPEKIRLPGEFKGRMESEILNIKNGTSGREFFCYLWHRIVEAYSLTRLTRAQDKLIAIGGIAKHLKKTVGIEDEYIVGMWRETLAYSLLWHVDEFDSNATASWRSVEYCAPTFSWASVHASVSFASFALAQSEALFEITHISLSHVTDDVFGLANDGFLELECDLRRLYITSTETSTKEFHGQVWIGGLEVTEEAYRRRLYLDEQRRFFDPATDCSDLFCVPASLKGEDSYLLVLLLQLADPSKAFYKRFGVLELGYRHSSKFEDFCDPSDDTEITPCVSFCDGRHTIRII